ncbi:MAG: hypothetical protein B7Z21_01750, partial [Verrucomicrobiales bacterium 32-60-5]
AFAFGGSYTITLRVSDGRGGLSTLTQTINVADPARTFTQRASGTTNNLNALAANSSTVVAAGDGGAISTSTDGVTWTPRSVTEFASNIYFRAAAWDGSQFILVGEDYNFTISAWVGVVYTSTDGATWTRRFLGTTASSQLYGVASNGSRAVAVGNNGTVLISNDSLIWGSGTASGITTQTLVGIAWNGSVFAFTGYTSGSTVVFTSTDGSSWMDRSLGAGVATWQDLRKIAWLNDRFVSSGWYSSLRISTDNAQTFTTTRPVAEETPAMAYGDGIYYTAGINHDASSANVDVLSPTPAQTFASWQTVHFPGGGAGSHAGDDADFDGVANLMEYGLAREPWVASGVNGAAGVGYPLSQSSRAWLHLDLPEPTMTDLIYTVQGSSTLVGGWVVLAQKVGSGAWTWQVGGASHVSLGTVCSGRLPVEIGMPDSADGQPRYFLRLQISAP